MQPELEEEGAWREVRELCRHVADDLTALVPGIVDRIRGDIPEYTSVPRGEHERHVHDQYRALLAGLATRRPPNAHEIGLARELGGERARQGLPVEAMISAYHIGYREMWNVLLSRADQRDTALITRLVRLVNLVWTWISVASSAAADAHTETLRSQQAAQINLVYRFLEALRGGRADSEEAESLARALAFDPAGRFQAVCTSVTSWSDDDLHRMQRELGDHHGTVHSAVRGALTVVVAQGPAADTVVSSIRRHQPDVRIGVGLRRRGLGGAEASIVDAERALAVAAGSGATACFEDEWLLATLHPQRSGSRPCWAASATRPRRTPIWRLPSWRTRTTASPSPPAPVPCTSTRTRSPTGWTGGSS